MNENNRKDTYNKATDLNVKNRIDTHNKSTELNSLTSLGHGQTFRIII